MTDQNITLVTLFTGDDKNVQQTIRNIRRGLETVNKAMDAMGKGAEKLGNTYASIGRFTAQAARQFSEPLRKASDEVDRHMTKIRNFAKVDKWGGFATASKIANSEALSAISNYTRAMDQAIQFNKEVTTGERVLISKKRVTESVIKTVEQAERSMEEASRSSTERLNEAQESARIQSEEIAKSVSLTEDDVGDLRKKIEELLGTAARQIHLSVDTKEAEQKIDALSKKLKRLQSKMKMKGHEAGAPAQNFHDGGRVYLGENPPGTDTVPAMLDAEEFVEPRKSTRAYGFEVFEGLKNLTYPIENVRRLVAARSNRFSEIIRRKSVAVHDRLQELQGIGFMLTTKPAIRNPVAPIREIILQNAPQAPKKEREPLQWPEDSGTLTIETDTGEKLKTVAPKSMIDQFMQEWERQRKRRRN